MPVHSSCELSLLVMEPRLDELGRGEPALRRAWPARVAVHPPFLGEDRRLGQDLELVAAQVLVAHPANSSILALLVCSKARSIAQMTSGRSGHIAATGALTASRDAGEAQVISKAGPSGPGLSRRTRRRQRTTLALLAGASSGPPT